MPIWKNFTIRKYKATKTIYKPKHQIRFQVLFLAFSIICPTYLYESFCEPGEISPLETPCYRCYNGFCWTNALLHLLNPGQYLLWVYHVEFHPVNNLHKH